MKIYDRPANPTGGKMIDPEIIFREIERAKCINDVCCYCAGHCPPYHRKPEGPNDAGNWEHRSKNSKYGESTRDRVMCKASAIFARARFEDAMRLNK
jgi:hypothetical protein